MATDVSERVAMLAAMGGPASPTPTVPVIPPLAVGGLVVTRTALVAALRLYVPQVADISVLEDGRFLLHLAEDPRPE